MKIKTRYGEYGGLFLPEILMTPIHELAEGFQDIVQKPDFESEFHALLKTYVGRETPLTEVPHFLSGHATCRLFLKREDLLHTGAHKINNALGQCLLAKKMGKTRIIAETGAGQHGVATAAAAARLGLSCCVYMGAVDMARQAPNVARMRLMGAEVIAVEAGSETLKEAVNAALRAWSSDYEQAAYCLGSALGPYPYPAMVTHFHAVIGKEARQQCVSQIGALPTRVVACVGGGSNAAGIFSAFLQDAVALVGVEAGGMGTQLGQHAARFVGGSPGILHGCYSYVLQDAFGQIAETHSISAGLDYPMIGPQHAAWHDAKRVEYTAVSDEEALAAFKRLSKTEGIIPALESSHALAYVWKQAPAWSAEEVVIVNLSGRGDKDMPQLMTMGVL